MAEEFKKIQPDEYYRKYLEHKQRPDGRSLSEFRSTSLSVGSIGTADGSALVKLGNTTVVCGLKVEVAVPKLDKPQRGYIVPNVELPAMCSPVFRPGPPSEQAQALSQLMLDIITNSCCVDLAELCIKEKELVWVLYCDMICLAYDGNIADACVVALMAALKNTTLPAVSVDSETNHVTMDSSQKVPITVHSFPAASTFAVFDKDIIFVDPTSEEESYVTGEVTIVTLADGKLCMVHKPGGSSMTEQQMQQCVQTSQLRSAEIRRLVDETLQSIKL